MRLEFHPRWEPLRVRGSRTGSGACWRRWLRAPIVVILSQDNCERYLVIDGHKRIAALEQLGQDTLEATVWAMSEVEALLLERSMRFSPQESALEHGWLLSEMQQRYGYLLAEFARRFDRGTSWVSRGLALVELPRPCG